MVLTVKNLTKYFKKGKNVFKAVDNVSFTLNKGEILGLLGPNGAGKTTTIQMLLGILTPTSGEIQYFGKDFFQFQSESLECVTHASAYHKLPGLLTVQENLEIYGHLYGLSSIESRLRIKQFLKIFDIEGLVNQSVRMLSAGQITRVMLCKAFFTYPKIVLLDEPTASLDPDIAKIVREFVLSEQKQRGVSIILTSHNMQEVAEVCERVLVLRHGKIIEEDTPEQLAKKNALSKVSLHVTEGLADIVSFLEGSLWSWKIVETNLTVEIDENQICHLLKEFALKNVNYSHIEINKPSLEDYFLSISRSL